MADDIAKSMGHLHTPKMVKMVDDMYKNVVLIGYNVHNNTKNSGGKAILIAEPGVYQILARTHKENEIENRTV